MNTTLKYIIAIILLAIVGAFLINDILESFYPLAVRAYRDRFNQMSNSETKKELINYTKTVLDDPIEGLDYLELLAWEHRHLTYTRGELATPRPEFPIPILLRGLGRCGEFALLYTGLCLANNIPVRLVMDCSMKKDNRTAGDHVWNQVYVNGTWIHVDPTENKINQPYLYRDQWDKNVNLVYAIDENGIVNVTDKYA